MPQLVGIALALYAGAQIALPAIIGAVIELAAIAFTVQGIVAASKAKSPDSAPTTSNLNHLRNLARSGNSPARVIYGHAKVSGVLVYAESADASGNPNPQPNVSDPQAKFLHMVVAVCEGPIDAFEQIFLNDLPMEDAAYKGKAIAIEQHGLRDQRAVRGPVSMASESVALPSDWTESHVGAGIAYLYMILKHDPLVFRAGAPQVRAIVRGRRVYDLRQDISRGGTHLRYDEESWEWSRNPAICLYDYLTNTTYGVGVPPESIDEESVIAAANICDQQVPIQEVDPGVTSHERYTCDGVFESDGNRLAIVDALKGAMGGDLIHRNGKFYMSAGAPLLDVNGRPPSDPLWEPAFTITADDLIEDMKVLPAPGRDQRANTITGSYINDRDGRYEEDSITPFAAPNWLNDDGGTVFAQPVDLPFTVDHQRAVRLAQLELRKSRLWAIGATARTSFAFADVTPYSLGAIYLPEIGWGAPTYPKGKPIVALTTTLNPDWACDIDWREYDEDAFDVSADGEPIIDQLPGTTLPSPFIVNAPRGVAAAAFADRLPDGTRTARVVVTWQAPQGMLVDHYVIGHKHRTDTTYLEGRSPSDTLSFEFFASRYGGYNLYVAAVGVTGTSSRRIHAAVLVDYVLLPPPDIRGFRVSTLGELRFFQWQLAEAAPTDLAGYQMRVLGPYATAEEVPTGNPNASWESARIFPAADAGAITTIASSFETSLPTKQGWYLFLVKAVDRSGLFSSNAAELFAEVAGSTDPKVLASEEASQLGWPGTIRNGRLSRVGNEIRSLSAQRWQDAPTWGDLTTGSDKAIVYDHPEIALRLATAFEPWAKTHGRNADIRVYCRVRDEGGKFGRYGSLRPGLAGKYVQFRLIAKPVDANQRFAVLTFAMRVTAEVQEERADDVRGVDGKLESVARIETRDRWWRRGELTNCVLRNDRVTADAKALALNAGAYLRQYAEAPTHAAYAALTNAWTFAVDVRTLDTAQTDRTIFCIGDQIHMRWKSAGGGTPTVDLTSASFTGEGFAARTAMNLADPALPYPDDGFAWHRIVYTYDGNRLRGYVDTVLRSEQVVNFALVPTGAPVRIGANAGLSGLILAKIDVRELQFWNRALSADEVSEASDGPLRGDEIGLVGYWRLDGDGTDLSPNANTMVLSAVSGDPGDLPSFVRTGSRFSPPYDLSVAGTLAAPVFVTWDGIVGAGESITVHVAFRQPDGTITAWTEIQAAGTQLLSAGVDYSGTRLLCRQVLRSTDPATSPNLQAVSVIVARQQQLGDYIYRPQLEFGSVDSARITAVQDLPIGARVTPAIVAKAEYGVRYKLALSDSLVGINATVDLEIKGAPLA